MASVEQIKCDVGFRRTFVLYGKYYIVLWQDTWNDFENREANKS